MTTNNKNTSPTICLFFDERGNGPSESRLIAREVREVREGDKIAVPRAFGLCWATPAPPYFVEDGGLMLTTDAATWLRDQLTAWLDAPRLAARETAEVVARDGNGVRLLRTSFEWGVMWQDNEDEWGVLWQDNEDDPDDGECEACRRFVNHADADIDEEGIYTCPDGTGCNVETPAAEVTP